MIFHQNFSKLFKNGTFFAKKCIFCTLFTVGAHRCILYGGLEVSASSSRWLLSRCLRLDFPLYSIESECEPGVAGICSALAVLRGVSEEWGNLVVSYSMSTVTWEQTQVSSAWSYSYGSSMGIPTLCLGGSGF